MWKPNEMRRDKTGQDRTRQERGRGKKREGHQSTKKGRREEEKKEDCPVRYKAVAGVIHSTYTHASGQAQAHTHHHAAIPTRMYVHTYGLLGSSCHDDRPLCPSSPLIHCSTVVAPPKRVRHERSFSLSPSSSASSSSVLPGAQLSEIKMLPDLVRV